MGEFCSGAHLGTVNPQTYDPEGNWVRQSHWNALVSHWGGGMTRASQRRGVRGAIIDGGIRDTKDILAQEFPIWYRYRTSNGSLSRCKITGY